MRRISWSKTAVLVLAGTLGARASAQPMPRSDAREIVQKMVDAMGGAARLRAVTSTRTKSIGYHHHFEQSERPEGPWIATYTQVNEVRDFEHSRLRHEEQARSFFYQSDNWIPIRWVFEGGVAASVGRDGRMAPRDAATAQQSEEALELGPERLGLTALSSSDLRPEPDREYRGAPHAVVTFTWRGFPVRILISRESGLPAAVELTRPRPESFYWGPWGDVTLRQSFALWMLEPGGLRLPRTTYTEWEGFPLGSQTIDVIEMNPASSDADFAIPADVREGFKARQVSVDDLPLGRPATPPVELSSGLTQVRGLWDVTIVRQSDGLVIFDGPISNGYSAKVIEDAQRRYPGLPIKAVVTTSDAWPHIGGMREYVARGIQVLALDHNRSILERLLASPRKQIPDTLARSPRTPKFTFVSTRMMVGQGPNRFELIPLRTVIGERQMVAWFPELKLLYSSDLFQRDQKGEFFVPQTVSEIISVAERESLDVKAVFAMHLPSTPWAEVRAAHEKNVASPSK